MKTIVCFTLCLGLAMADLSWDTEPLTYDVNNKYDQHFSQHQASIQAARKGVAERFTQMGVSGVYGGHASSSQYGARQGSSSYSDHSSSSHASNYGCTTGCENTASRFSANSDAETFGSDIGYGTVGFSGGANERQKYSSSSQHERVQSVAPVQVYPATNTRSRYSASSHQERVGSAQQVPILTYPIGGGAATSTSSRFATHQRVGTVQAVPVQVQVYPTGGTERFVSHSERVSEVKAIPVVPIYTPSTDREHFSSRSDSFVEKQAPITYSPSSNSERYSSRSDRIAEKLSAPIPVHVYAPPTTTSDSYANRERAETYSESQSSIPVYHQPIYAPSQSERTSNRIESLSESSAAAVPVYQAPVDTRYSASAHQESSSSRVNAIPIIAPSASSNSAYSRQESYSNSGRNYVPIVPVPAETSVSSAQYAEQQERRVSGGLIGGVASGHIGGAVSSHNDYSGSYASGNRLGTRLGPSSDLSEYMSESERLAKIQSTGVYNSQQAVRGSATVDSRYGSASSGSGLNSLGGAGNGYQRTKSWETSSKWASGSQYGDDGKPKSYSMLSTAESENHNINGHETGYKAATTTLDDDGKVSTYSIHTP